MADQIGRVLELLRLSSYILFRKTKNIILNTRIILQLKKPALASHSSVPGVGDSTEPRQQRTRLIHSESCLYGDFFQPELPSPATRFHGLLACISTNGSFMGGLVTLDRNLWGYSSILVLHTPPLDKAKGGSMSQIALFLRFWSENRHRWSKQVQRKSENGPRTVRE